MPTPERISRIRDLVVEDRLEDAFSGLLPELEKSKKDFPSGYRHFLSIQAEWSSLERDRRAGILSAEQQNLSENRIRNRFLNLLDQLEKGPEPKGPGRVRNRTWIYALAALLVLGLGGWGLSRWFTANTCPDFEENDQFRILVHPYQALQSSESPVRPHKAILARFDKLRSRYEINTSPRELITNYNPFLGSAAEDMADQCRAQLVIWGSYEPLPDESYLMTTQFQFFTPSGKINMRKAEWDAVEDQLSLGETGTTLSPYGFINDTISNFTSIISDGALTDEIENTLFYLFGMIAHQSNNSQTAIELLSMDGTELDSANQLLRTMSLADSYLAEGQVDQSLQTYDRVLTIHPDYPLALNNRAYLNIAKGNLQQSIEDLNRKIAMDPKDTQALKARWEVYLRSDQIEKAEEDLERIIELAPQDPQIDSLRSRTRKVRRKINPTRRSRY